MVSDGGVGRGCEDSGVGRVYGDGGVGRGCAVCGMVWSGVMWWRA